MYVNLNIFFSWPKVDLIDKLTQLLGEDARVSCYYSIYVNYFYFPIGIILQLNISVR